MTKFTICGLNALQSALDTKPDLVISIANPGDGADSQLATNLLKDFKGHVIPLRFHDVERLVPNRKAASFPMCHDLLEKIRTMDRPEHVLVHCSMGMCRSPAIAMLVIGGLMDQDEPTNARAEKIVNQVLEAAPHAEPNKRVVEISDILLEMDAELAAKALKWDETELKKAKSTKPRRRLRR